MAALESTTLRRPFGKREILLLSGLLVGFALAVAAIASIQELFLPLLMSIFFYYLLSQMVNNLERRGVSRGAGTGIVFLGFLVVFFLAVYVILQQMRGDLIALIDSAPNYIDTLAAQGALIERSLRDSFPFIGALNLHDRIASAQPQIDAMARETVVGMVPDILGVISLSPIITYYLLKDARTAKKALVGMVPNRYFEMTINMLNKMDKQVGDYIRSRMIESGVVAVVVLIGLWLIGVPFALQLALVAGVLNLIPYIGPVLAAIPAIAIATIGDGGSASILAIIGVYVAAQVIDNMFVIPLLVAKIVNQHGLTVVILVIIGAQLMGIVGMIIFIPLYSIAKVVVVEYYTGIRSLRT